MQGLEGRKEQRNPKDAEIEKAKCNVERLKEARKLWRSLPDCTRKEMMQELQVGEIPKGKNTRSERSTTSGVDNE